MSSAEDSKLGSRAEALLSDWPSGERDWEALAVRTVERARAATDGVAEELLSAPLPPEAGEPGFEQEKPPASAPSEVRQSSPRVSEVPPKEGAAKATASAAPKSLADLARASVKKKAEANKDMALESLAVASQARAQAGEIAERVQAARKAAIASTPDVESGPKSQAPAPASVAPQSAPASIAPQQAPSRGPWIVGGLAFLAAAAAFALGVGRQTQQPITQAPPATPEATQAVAAAPAPGEPAQPGQADPGNVPGSRDVSQLPVAGHPRAGGGPAPAKAAAPVAAAPSALPAGVNPDPVVLEDEQSAPAKQAAAAAPAAPAAATPAPAAEPLRPAEGVSLPQQPSLGAANAAIGSVMGAARACVAGQQGASSVNVVFGSDGKVQRVTVSGPAAGTPAGACIESAFKKARVQPFAKPSFAVPATVRPQ